MNRKEYIFIAGGAIKFGTKLRPLGLTIYKQVENINKRTLESSSIAIFTHHYALYVN